MAIVNSDKNIPTLTDKLSLIKVVESKYEYVVELDFESENGRKKHLVAHLHCEPVEDSPKLSEATDNQIIDSFVDLVLKERATIDKEKFFAKLNEIFLTNDPK